MSPTLYERCGTIKLVIMTLLVATDPGDITRMVVAVVALSSNKPMCYQMIMIAMAENITSRKTVATQTTAATAGSVISSRRGATVETGYKILIAKVRSARHNIDVL
jgi:hypothetical protein